jgi:hypothetical protein
LALAPEFTGKQPLGSFLAKFFFFGYKKSDMIRDGQVRPKGPTSEDSHHQLTGGVLG